MQHPAPLLLPALLTAVAGCAAPAPGEPVEKPVGGPSPFAVEFEAVDATYAADLERLIEPEMRKIEAFFALPFAEPFDVHVLPGREAFDAAFPPEWGMGKTRCWMVAAGVAGDLWVLSPRVWASEACEHDPEDAAHVRRIVAHELVHVFHMQHNPTRDATGMDPVGWFVEGLATYVSGQLAEEHEGAARDAVEAGLAPERLEDAWTGRYRYGVSGGLVRHLDLARGRKVLADMLPATTEEELLAIAEFAEDELLDEWAAVAVDGVE